MTRRKRCPSSPLGLAAVLPTVVAILAVFGTTIVVGGSSWFVVETPPRRLDMKQRCIRCIRACSIILRTTPTARSPRFLHHNTTPTPPITLFATMGPRVAYSSSSAVAAGTGQQDNDSWSFEELRRRLQTYLLQNRTSHTMTSRRPGADHAGLCVAIAGGGGSFLSTLAATPGASSVLLDGTVLYGRESYQDYLLDDHDNVVAGHDDETTTTTTTTTTASGRSTSRVVSAISADRLANAAVRRALRLIATHGVRDDELRHYRSARGLSCTSALTSSSPSNGDENGPSSTTTTTSRRSNAYLACRGALSDDPTVSMHVELGSSNGNGRRSRFDEDVFLGHLLLTTLQLYETAAADDAAFTTTTADHTAPNDKGDAAATADTALSLLPAGLTVVHRTKAGDELKVESDMGDEIHVRIIGGRTATASSSSTTTTRAKIEAAAERILSGMDRVVLLRPNDDNTDLEVLHSAHVLPHSLVVPGSFNPPHRGHVALARAAATATAASSMAKCDICYFELSITNPDKPSMPAAEVAKRVLKFLDLDGMSDIAKWGILLTDAPLFVQKAAILPPPHRYHRLTFAIGSDTFVRLIDPKYYGDSQMEMLTALHTMNCNFVVGGRVQQQPQKPAVPAQQDDAGGAAFISGLDQLKALPATLAARFHLLPEFRVDISSTELRRQQQEQQQQQ